MSACELQLMRLNLLITETKNQREALGIDRRLQLLALGDEIDRPKFLGPLLIGSFLEIALFGVLVMQLRNYYRRALHDALIVKFVAWFSFLASLALTVAMFVESRYRCLVASAQVIQDSMTVSNEIANCMIAILALHSQAFFAWRIFELSRKWWLVALVACLGVTEFAAFVVVNVRSWDPRPPHFNIHSYDPDPNINFDFIHTASRYSSWIRDPSTAIWMGVSIACHLTITVTMGILLLPALRDAVSSQKRPKIGSVLSLTFETGITTTTSTIVMTGLLFSQAPATQYVRYILYYPSGVLYSSSLLASLNARPPTVNGLSSTTKAKGVKPASVGAGASTRQRDELTFTILTAVEEDRDGEEGSSIESFGDPPTPPPKDGPQHSLV